MPNDDRDETEDQFAARAEAFERALAAGLPTAEGLEPADSDADPAFLAVRASLLALERVWPRAGEKAESAAGCVKETPSADSRSMFGRFRIVRELGRGGFGVVFLAVDPELNRLVALKLPRVEALLNDDVRARFVRESKAAAAFDHPNLVPLYEAGEIDSICYLASAYCEGPTLAEWLRAQSAPTPFATVVELAIGLADAVAHSHERGVLHRDLKPSNVMMALGRQPDAAPTPRITDFGLARMMDVSGEERTASFAAMGSAPYMAPEQIEGLKIGPACDVYGLGAILYVLVCGRPPHQGRNDLDILRRATFDDVTPLRRIRPDTPRDLEAICLKCLERRPARRYASARELADDLRRFQAGGPIKARPPSLAARGLRAARRHRWKLVALAVASVLVASGLEAWRRRVEIATVRRETDEHDRKIDRQVADVRLTRYVEDIRQAADDLRATRPFLTIRLLHQSEPKDGEPDLREFAWHYLMKWSHTERLSLEGHPSDVYHAEFSPDGKTIASCGMDGSIRLWEGASGKPIGFVRESGPEVNWVRYSPNGRKLAATDDDGSISVWDLVTGTAAPPRVFRAHQGETSIVLFTPDGRSLVSVGRADGLVKRWDAETLELLASFPVGGNPFLETAALSPDGRTLATGSASPGVKLWDLETGAQIGTLGAANGQANGLAYSSDGKLLAVGTAGQLLVWEWATGRLVREFRQKGADINSVVFTPDDAELVYGMDDGVIRVVRVATGEPLAAHQGHTLGIWSLSIVPDGRTIVSTSRDDSVKLWDLRVPENPRRLVVPRAVQDLAFSADGRTIVAACNDGLVMEYDVPNDRLREAARLGGVDRSQRRALSGNGSVLAQFGTDGAVEVHDLAGRRPPGRIAVKPDVEASFDLDGPGDRLAIAENGRRVDLWDLDRMKPIASLKGPYTWPVFIAHDRIVIVDPQTGKGTLWMPLEGRTTPITTGGRFGSTLETRASALVNRIANGGHAWFGRTIVEKKAARQLYTHQQIQLCLDVSPDGKTLASGDDQGALKLWDVAAYQKLIDLFPAHLGPVSAVVFSHDGRMLATAATLPDGTGEIRIWETSR